MNKGLKPILFTAAILAVLGVANAQEAKPVTPAPAPAAVTPAVSAPAAQAPATPASAPAAAVPAVPAPVVKTPAPAIQAPAAPVAAPVQAPAAPAHAVPAAHVPVATPAAAPSTQVPPAAPVVETVAADSAVIAPKADSIIALVVEEPKRKKSRKARTQKTDLTIVDIPANFEIEARKIMPVDSKLGDDNLDTWWGRANLMLLTESDNFIGKIHLRMYPGAFYGDPVVSGPEGTLNREYRDVLELHEAWAWHRGDYVNVKVGRWDNTTRFGSQTFGGYVDARRDQNLGSNRADVNGYEIKSRNDRKSGFMSTFEPENALQFGFNNFSENVSFDIALISNDRHLNNGDLRMYFSFKELASIERMNIGIGYRSNIFDEIYNARGDVTHTVSAGFSAPLINDIGILKGLTLFAEAAMIGLDDQDGQVDCKDSNEEPYKCIDTPKKLDKSYRYDKGKTNDIILPILLGLEVEFYEGLDKIVIEAEYDGDRLNPEGKKGTGLQGSFYVQKKLNDRFTLNMGVQSENNTKDFSFAGRLQGRIN